MTIVFDNSFAWPIVKAYLVRSDRPCKLYSYLHYYYLRCKLASILFFDHRNRFSVLEACFIDVCLSTNAAKIKINLLSRDATWSLFSTEKSLKFWLRSSINLSSWKFFISRINEKLDASFLWANFRDRYIYECDAVIWNIWYCHSAMCCHCTQWWAQRRCSPAGATSGATFSVAVAAAPLLFFVTSDKRQRCCFFLAEKAAALQRCFLSKFSAATANKLLPRLFQFTFSHLTIWSLYSPLVFTLLLLPPYFSLVEHTRPLWRFVVALILYV